MLVARRGLGPEELRLIHPGFREAVRWALFAEKLSVGLGALRDSAGTDPPRGLTGPALLDFRAVREANRGQLKERHALLYPPYGELDPLPPKVLTDG